MYPSVTEIVPSWYKRSIGEGDTGPDVKVVLRKLGLDPDGSFDALAAARVKGVARSLGIYNHGGVVDEMIARALGEQETVRAGVLPSWFALRRGDQGDAVGAAARLLGVGGQEFSEEMETAVRRLQSASRIEPTGILDAETARILGEL